MVGMGKRQGEPIHPGWPNYIESWNRRGDSGSGSGPNEWRKDPTIESRSLPSRAPFHTVGAAGRADGFGISFGLFRFPLEMPRLDPPRPELFLEHAWGRKQLCPLLDLIERLRRKLLYLEQLFPVGEVAVALAVAHDPVSNILGDPGELREFLRRGGIDVDFSSHARLDGKPSAAV